jgi:tetratricopeptide (TPR) repeat protein
LGQGTRATEPAAEALACARRSGEIDSITRALYVSGTTLLGHPDTATRLELAGEVIELSEAGQSKRNLLDGLVLRANTRLEVADLAGFHADADALVALGDTSHWWAATFLGRALQVNGLIVQGRLADADTLLDTLLAQGPHDVNAMSTYAAQLFLLRREQGRLPELEDLLVLTVEQNPGIVGFRAALAVAMLDLGRRDEARPHLDALVTDDGVAAPHDQTWLATGPLLAEVAVSTGARDAARVLQRELEPFAGLLAVAGSGVICLGAVNRYLGMLAGSLGDRDAAVHLYEAALEQEEGCGASALATRTRSWYGRYLFHADGETPRARALLDQARRDARALGLDQLARHLTS